MTVSFFVPGVPATAGSKRAFVYTPKDGGKPRAVVVDDAQQKGKPWRVSVQAAALEARQGRPLLEGPLELEVTFVMPRPRGHFDRYGRVRTGKLTAFPIVRPDATKMLRLLEDSLSGVVYRDDAAIVTLVVRKRYEFGSALEVGARVIVRQVHVYDDAQGIGVVNVKDMDQGQPALGASATLPGLR